MTTVPDCQLTPPAMPTSSHDPQNTSTLPKSSAPHKIKRLPESYRVQKRPILHSPIPSPYTNASSQKVLYISSRTPFISAVKRARKLLAVVDQRSLGKVSLSKGTEKEHLRQLGQKGSEREQVFLKGTGKAIEKVLGLAVYFQSQDDIEVRIKTGSVGVVDDIERKEGNRGSDQDDGDGGGVEVGEEIAETQIRKASVIEVAISLK